MKRAVTLFAVIAALGLVFAGCKKKPAEKKGGDDTMQPAAMDDMADDMMEPDMMAAADDMMEPDMMEPDMMAAADDMGGGDGNVGVAECDEYLKVYKCYLGKLPAAAQPQAKAAFMKTVEAWKKALAGPAKAHVGKGCKMALDAWKKAMAKNPMIKGCL